jgi:hypothetical protein
MSVHADHAARPDRTPHYVDALLARGEPYELHDPKHPHYDLLDPFH